MFQLLKHVLQDRLRAQGVGEAVLAAQAVDALKQEVAARFGPGAAQNLRKVVLRGDTLEVLAGSGALASELRMAEADLVDALKARLLGKAVKLRIFG